MMKQHPKNTKLQRAFSLLEVLLAVGIMATILAIGTVITTDLARQIVNEKAAGQMLTLQRAGEEYATSNFNKLLNSAVAGNIASPTSSRVVNISTLISDGFLPNGFEAENLLNLDMALYLRNATNISGVAPIATIEVITVTSGTPATPRGQTFKWILDTALFGGGKLGVLSNIGAGFNNVSFTSTNGSWNVPIGNISSYSPSLPTASNDPSGYIAAYGRVTSEDVFDSNVLYRIPIAGNPNLNRMQTGLNMNNNGLTDVGTLTAEQMNTGNVNLNSTGRYALSSTGTMNFGAGTTSMSGDMVVYGVDPAAGNSLTANSVNLGTGSLNAGSIATDTLNAGADGLVANNLNTVSATSQDLIANGTLNLNSVNTVSTSNMQLGGSSGSTTLTADNLTAGNLVAGEANVTGGMTVTNDGISTVNNMSVGGGATVRSLGTNKATFTDLCYTTGAKDDINGC